MSRAEPLFDREELDLLLQNLDTLTDEEVYEVEKMVEELDKRATLQAARDDLIAFCLYIDPTYKVGRHHRILADKLMEIERGAGPNLSGLDGNDRVCVNIPPRHGKSQLVSIYFPAWFIGRNAGKKVMLVSHTTDLAVDFGRKVRNLIDTDAYKDLFPAVSLATDSKSAGRWNTSTGCEFYATGVGSALAGRGADLLLVDDPHSEQDILNGNFSSFAKAYEWFAFGARTRLMPGGRVAIVHCMAGDTSVLMAGGSEKPLRDVRPGDMVGSYKDGGLVSREVLNWANQGVDAIFTITLSDGKNVRANAGHPFLVRRAGVETWVRVRDLRPGDSLVSITVGEWGKQKQNQACATAVSKKQRALEKAWLSGRTIGTLAASASQTGVRYLQYVRGYADPTTTSNTGLRIDRRWTPTRSEITTYNVSMASASPITAPCLSDRTSGVLSAATIRMKSLFRNGFAMVRPLWSITAILLEKFGSCCATGAISSYRKALLNSSCSAPFSTSEIISILPDGEEDVFDIQVEDTENFIANGIVSHNTRWHTDDLTGRLLRDMVSNEGSDQYEVVEFPAILDVEVEDDEGNIALQQKPLWPEFFDLTALLRTKASMPTYQWNSQYQQNPTAEEAAIIKREWWQLWLKDEPPAVEYIIMSLDAAAETNNRADYTALTVWGVFVHPTTERHEIILLNSIKRRLEFPELKALCLEEYKHWEPDSFIVEKKSAGTAVFQELRRMGIPVAEYTPHRGTGDKLARLNSISDIIASEMVWVPAKRWAEELVEEVAGFPFASHDDLVDSMVMAMLRFRQGGFIRLPSDEQDDELPYRQKVDYY